MITSLMVEGMVCTYCEASIRDALMGVEGVEDVWIRLDVGRVDVYYDESEVDLEEIVSAVEDLGYRVLT